MNRNVESHFSRVPFVDIERSVFDRSHTHKTTFNTGELIPIYWDEILPGDSVKMTTSKVVRLQTMLTPIMDNMYLDTFWFFIPNRLIWSHWKNFMGESESAWVSNVEYSVPVITPPASTGWAVGTIADHLGVPVNVPLTTGISALPFRAYALVCSEFFRDENLMQPLAVSVGDSATVGVNTGNQITDIQKGGKPFIAAKFHDRFTSGLPGPQRSASPVTIQLADSTSPFAPVYPRNVDIGTKKSKYGMSGVLNQNDTLGTAERFLGSIGTASGTSQTYYVTGSSDTTSYKFSPTNLWADLSNGLNAVTINELRLAFQLQRFYERSARSGNRYIEFISGFFGVHSPDYRLQRPEYLGGNRVPLNIHEVTNSAQSEADFLGDLGAKSATADVNFDFEKSFTEHGILLGVACVRYDHSYAQGLERKWRRLKFEQFYLPTFAHLGEMPIMGSEIYCQSESDMAADNVFAYQEAWSEYRYAENHVSGLMRPGVTGSLASWHLSDYYASKPTYSASWIQEDKTNVDRVLAVTSSVSDQIFADFYFDATWSRPMPMYSVPGLIDHF